MPSHCRTGRLCGASAMYTHSAVNTSSHPRKPSSTVKRFGQIDLEDGLPIRRVRFHKEQAIFAEGDPTTDVYSVVSGAIRTYKLLGDGRRQILSFCLPNELFGLDFHSTRTLAADAIVDTDVIVARRRDLEALARNNRALARDLWLLTARLLSQAEDHLLLLGRKTATERVVTFLIETDRRRGGDGVLPLPMTRCDIGDHLGLTLETVSRVFSALQADGIVDTSHWRGVVLRNRERLRSLLE